MRVFVFGAALAASISCAEAAESPVCVSQAASFGPARTMGEALTYMANATYRNFSPRHGNQIEHATAGGRVFLWYPGNSQILPGRWKLEPRALAGAYALFQDCRATKLLHVCFQYGANTYNPVTGSWGVEWECEPFGYFVSKRVERVAGDPLGLARMERPPFPLPRGNQTIEAVRAQMPR